MTKKKKALVMSVLCAVVSVGFVMGASAETMHGNLEEVVIEGNADVFPGGGWLPRLVTLVSLAIKM